MSQFEQGFLRAVDDPTLIVFDAPDKFYEFRLANNPKVYISSGGPGTELVQIPVTDVRIRNIPKADFEKLRPLASDIEIRPARQVPAAVVEKVLAMACYLTMFHTFGYQLILREDYQSIREYLQYSKDKIYQKDFSIPPALLKPDHENTPIDQINTGFFVYPLLDSPLESLLPHYPYGLFFMLTLAGYHIALPMPHTPQIVRMLESGRNRFEPIIKHGSAVGVDINIEGDARRAFEELLPPDADFLAQLSAEFQS